MITTRLSSFSDPFSVSAHTKSCSGSRRGDWVNWHGKGYLYAIDTDRWSSVFGELYSGDGTIMEMESEMRGGGIRLGQVSGSDSQGCRLGQGLSLSPLFGRVGTST